MYDPYNRRINYLRISVTDRCNFRCVYCMPEEGIDLKSHKDILSFQEIEEIVRYGVGLGVNKIRITGGEPLVRKDLPELISRLAKIPGIEDIGLTTNGVLLPKFAEALKNAGLNRVNISLDTLDEKKFRSITRTGELRDVLEGIEAALTYGLHPVKINFVKMPGVNEEETFAIKKYCEEKGIQVRYIRQMNLKTGEYYPVDGGTGGICSVCNRLRLTSDGFLVPCLHSSLRFDTRLGIEQAYKQAIELKPEKGVGTESHEFSNIGG